MSETMDVPSLLDINIDDAIDLQTIPDGTEVELRIKHAEIAAKKDDPTRFNLMVVLEDPTDVSVDDIKIWLAVPTEATKSEDPKKYNKQVLRIKKFYECFGISSPQSTEELVGSTGYCVVGESEDPQYGLQNYVREFVVNR